MLDLENVPADAVKNGEDVAKGNEVFLALEPAGDGWTLLDARIERPADATQPFVRATALRRYRACTTGGQDCLDASRIEMIELDLGLRQNFTTAAAIPELAPAAWRGKIDGHRDLTIVVARQSDGTLTMSEVRFAGKTLARAGFALNF